MKTIDNLESELMESLKLSRFEGEADYTDWACGVMSCYDVDRYDHTALERAARIYHQDGTFRGVHQAAVHLDEVIHLSLSVSDFCLQLWGDN